jgi:hypothetical protein
MSASGGYGPIKVAQGIVGFADLALGDRVEPVLEALLPGGDHGLGELSNTLGAEFCVEALEEALSQYGRS